MSLNWDLTKVKNCDDVCFHIAEEDYSGDLLTPSYKKGDRVMRSTTRSLVFATMTVGIGSITKKNWKKFFVRLSMFEKLNGAFRARRHKNGDLEDVYFTTEDVKSHIGLSVNVSNESDQTFYKKLRESYEREIGINKMED